MIIGSVGFHKWTNVPVMYFRATYIVYMVLNWSLLGALIIVVMICVLVVFLLGIGLLVRSCRQRRMKKLSEPLLEEDKSCCKCCHTKGEKECCGRCHRCCLDYDVDPTRERINNSCCCNGCCSCCVDCCISCCGEKNVELPDGITANDIVMANPHHHIIYVPDPNAPVTMSNVAASPNTLSHMAGVGSLQNSRHFLYELQLHLTPSPAVFYSDLQNTTVGTERTTHT